VTDQVGSVRLVVRIDDGEIVQRIDYDEFGVVFADSAPGFQPFGFAHGLYDADTGLVRFGARDYDAETGRWTTKEPLGFAGSFNFYSYCHNDPVNYIDRTGLQPETPGQTAPVSTPDVTPVPKPTPPYIPPPLGVAPPEIVPSGPVGPTGGPKDSGWGKVIGGLIDKGSDALKGIGGGVAKIGSALTGVIDVCQKTIHFGDRIDDCLRAREDYARHCERGDASSAACKEAQAALRACSIAGLQAGCEMAESMPGVGLNPVPVGP
jgi:RHS repeat-associated protein